MTDSDGAARGPAPTGASRSALARPVRVIGRVGINLLPFFDESEPAKPATNASWAWSLRRFARAAVWLLPGYAALYIIVTFGGTSLATIATVGGSVRFFGLLLANWLGMLALLSLACLLATARSRQQATAGALIALFGTLLMPLSGVGVDETGYAGHARVLALAGGAVFSVGLLFSGLAVVRSEVFGPTDGTLLMIAAPMLGLGGLLLPVLRTVGALLVLAAGVGIAWKTGRLLPRPTPTLGG
ncbi:hypothetical protein ACFQ0D_29000, partial [Micromonospora zhanjiangensis]